METTVVNVKYDKDPQIIYIGRANKPHHFGNPFTHLGNTSVFTLIVLPTREMAIEAYRDWLAGTRWVNIEPQRRLWILSHIDALKGKKLGCYCKPLGCHGDVLIELINQTKG